MSEKDGCLNERSKLELKHARAVHDIAQELENKKTWVQKLETEHYSMITKAEEARSSGEHELASEFLAKVYASTMNLSK